MQVFRTWLFERIQNKSFSRPFNSYLRLRICSQQWNLPKQWLFCEQDLTEIFETKDTEIIDQVST